MTVRRWRLKRGLGVKGLGPVQAIAAWLAAWALVFAVWLVALADTTTSRQWIWLFSVPGGEWTWGALFAAGAALSAVGLWSRRYRVAAAGQFVIGTDCLAVAVLYVIAPRFLENIVTLNYLPWIAVAGVLYYLTAANWSETW